MQFYFNIDSLILVSYALILIIVVLTQREALMNTASFFKFSELFKFGSDDDEELEQLEEDVKQLQVDNGVYAGDCLDDPRK